MNLEWSKLMSFVFFETAQGANERSILAFAVKAYQVQLLRRMRGFPAFHIFYHKGWLRFLHVFTSKCYYYQTLVRMMFEIAYLLSLRNNVGFLTAQDLQLMTKKINKNLSFFDLFVSSHLSLKIPEYFLSVVICSELSLQGGKQIIMLNQDRSMFDSNYPSIKKRPPFEDTTYLPTAERSTYHPDQYTPTRLNLSPSKRSQRLSGAHKSINEAIELASGKKELNREAIEEVRSLNQEILGSLSSYCPSKSQHYQPARNRTADRTRDDYSRDYVATSQFEWGQPHHEQELKRSQRESVLGNENLELKGRLNEEIRKNNELLRYIKSLESENATLRNSGYGGAGLLEENRQLRNQLQGGISVDMLEELRRLKEENQLLRRDTITLLKKASR